MYTITCEFTDGYSDTYEVDDWESAFEIYQDMLFGSPDFAVIRHNGNHLRWAVWDADASYDGDVYVEFFVGDDGYVHIVDPEFQR